MNVEEFLNNHGVDVLPTMEDVKAHMESYARHKVLEALGVEVSKAYEAGTDDQVLHKLDFSETRDRSIRYYEIEIKPKY